MDQQIRRVLQERKKTRKRQKKPNIMGMEQMYNGFYMQRSDKQ